MEQQRTEVYRNGVDGYPFYRIPSLIAVNATLLLAFAEGRGQRTDHGKVDIVVRRSFDSGASWSPHSLVTAGLTGTIGNPSPLFDGGEIALFFCRENLEILETRSSDYGSTWTAPIPIRGWSRPEEWKWVAAGPPAALVTRSGRWVLPCDGLTGHKQIYKATGVFSFVLLSDDRGATWRQGPLLDGGNECQAAELPNGSLALNMRSTEAVRLHSLSVDGGESWSAPRRATPPVIDANCEGSMITLGSAGSGEGDGESSSLLLATNAGIGRRVLTARTSRDGGQRWSTHVTLEDGPAAYSALADLGGGWAGCLYETERDAIAKAEPAAEGGAAGGGEAERKRSPKRLSGHMNVIEYVRFNVSAAPPETGAPSATPTSHGDEL